jgi:NAD(P)-dependent dehydrogenase (short-subunit alcohol dehydrogenase family)
MAAAPEDTLDSPARGGSRLSAYLRKEPLMIASIVGLVPGLEGKRALVTGGTRGMGEAVAGLLADSGARVVVAGRHGPDGFPVPVIEADLSSPEGATLVASRAVEIFGGLDIIVHCVGTSSTRPGGALALTDDDWAQALSTNLLSAVRVDRALLPGMVKQGSGAIVHVASLQWKRPHESSPAYGPAKAALRSYSKGLATEFGPAGIRVNTVTPGYIATPLAEARITEMMAQDGSTRQQAEAALLAIIGGVPLGRPGTTAEVAQLVAFLVSDSAAYLTGGEFVIDGGNNRVL